MPKLKAANRTKRKDSAINGRGRRVIITHGGRVGALREARLDRRTKEWEFEQEHIGAMIQHMGGPDMVTTPMAELIQQCARLKLLETLAWAYVLKHGFIIEGQVTPAYAALLASMRTRADLLLKLGLERRSRELTLGDALRSQVAKERAEVEDAQ